MSCDHRIVVEGICRECRCGVSRLNDDFQAFNYLAHGLSLRHEFVGALKSRVSRNSLQEKKLHLVLSLHGTLFDYQSFRRLSNREKYLKGIVNSRDDLWQTRIRGHELLVKLRPFVHEFLREANKLFVLHLQTFCIPEYADFVINLLDPHHLYFGDRIITSKHANMWNKNLDLVLAGERQVIILDDRYDSWWPEHRSNLLQITTYSYFKATKKKNDNLRRGIIHNLSKFLMNMIAREDSTSYSEKREDEIAEDGALANALRFLTKVHHNFFNQDYNHDNIYNRDDVRVFLHS